MDESSDFRDGMPFLGGSLWIDFVNSAPVALGDLIATPQAWQRWCAAAGLAPGDGGETPARLAEAHALREALARLFEALMHCRAGAEADVALVNAHLARAISHPWLHAAANGVATETVRANGSDPLVAIAADFASFATSFEPGRMRHCGNPHCSLVFYDTARNGTRRWCSMATCGNRQKARSHRARAATLRCT